MLCCASLAAVVSAETLLRNGMVLIDTTLSSRMQSPRRKQQKMGS